MERNVESLYSAVRVFLANGWIAFQWMKGHLEEAGIKESFGY